MDKHFGELTKEDRAQAYDMADELQKLKAESDEFADNYKLAQRPIASGA